MTDTAMFGVDCGSSGKICGKTQGILVVPEVIKVNLLKNNLLTNKPKVSNTLLVLHEI